MSRRNTARKQPQPTKRYHKQSVFDKLLESFCQLTEPTQVVLIIGILLLIAWIVTQPDVLQGIVRAFQFWFIARSLFIR